MAVSVVHAKVSAVADEGDATEVQPSDWNAEHTVSGLGTAAEQNLAAFAQTANNLSDLAAVATARTNLGLGTAAVVNTGTSGTTIPLLDGINTWSVQNTFAAGTITTSQPATWTQTWNAAGVTFNAFLINVTATASAAGSLLADLQVASTSKFKIRKGGGVRAASGAASDTAYGIIGFDTAGIVGAGDGSFDFAWSGNIFQNIGASGVTLASTNYFAFSSAASGNTIRTTADTFLYRDGAANTIAQRNATAAQTSNLYDTWASTTDYHRLAMKTARATLSGVSGASVTATAIIPDGAIVMGVTTKVTTGLGVSNGTTGYQVGDGTDVDRWGDITGTASGTSSDNTNWTATTIQAFIAASDIVITAKVGNFDGTGVIYVSVQYLIGQCD